MGKKKIALFYDEGTESGKQILQFLMPFDKRKSDIVGELILLWIAEHGTNVPVQWLDRKRESGTGELRFPDRVTAGEADTRVQGAARSEKSEKSGGRVREGGREGEAGNVYMTEEKSGHEKSPEEVHDVSMIKAGLAAFM